MNTPDFDKAVERYHQAASEFVKGTPLALSYVGENRWLRRWSGPHRCTEMAR